MLDYFGLHFCYILRTQERFGGKCWGKVDYSVKVVLSLITVR